MRRQTGRAQAGAVAQGGRQLDKYAWLQVPTLAAFFLFLTYMPRLSWGLSDVPAPHRHMCIAIGKALLLQLHFCILYPLPSYSVPWQHHLPQQSVYACVSVWHVFVVQQDACLAPSC